MERAILDLWNRAFGAAFPMDLRLWRQNLDGHPSWDPGGLFLEGPERHPLGLAVARRTDSQAWLEALAVDPDARGRGVGSRLLERATAWGAGRPWRLGAGPAHFFPGVPEDCPGAEAFFARRGFRADWEAWDLLGRFAGEAPPPLPAGILPCPAGAVGALLEFLGREFPGRWLEDTRLRLERGESPGEILVALRGHAVEGFCHVYHPGCATLGPSVSWREAMGPAWGGLGPIGVGRAQRGRGLGRDLVEGAVRHLRNLGCRTIAVDWTILLDFYGRFSFRPWRRYRGMLRA